MAEMTRRKLLVGASFLLAVAGLTAVAYFAARWVAAPPDGEDGDLAADGSGEEPDVVSDEDLPGLGRGERFERVRPLVRDVFETFPGRLGAEGGIQVRALQGQRMAVVKIHKWEGDAVKKGEVLVELNDEQYRRELAKAKAAGDDERVKHLQEMIAAAKVRSPVDGYVLEVHRDVGEIPLDTQEGGGLPLVTLADPNAYSFRATVPQQAVAAAGHLGAKFQVEFENGTRAEGTVTGYEAAPEGSATLVLGMEATPGLEQDLRGSVRVPTSKEEVALVPKKAVTRRGGVAVVRVFENDTRSVAERTIATDGEIGDDLVVTAGVFAGEAVVVPDR